VPAPEVVTVENEALTGKLACPQTPCPLSNKKMVVMIGVQLSFSRFIFTCSLIFNN
jgi:transposase-like protein